MKMIFLMLIFGAIFCVDRNSHGSIVNFTLHKNTYLGMESSIHIIFLPLFSYSWHDDKKGHQECGKYDVDGESLNISDDRGPVRLRVKCWSAMFAEQVKPASSHFDLD